ncbi:metallophosphatase family protein [Endozoicomonas gorgoniicola]|uniref:Metallophosphatase family protein n=1 Tax=Endozoicomonas gorgoniicola TaxID=1234144 RepID=A0ABT3MQJ7_9GAMM|nr:metallophosphoesterase family protein [Endozoicomonas gorgoniicola]MCW7551592.1 metallophosphatase family protein [Endozoicomonas gorgoniicola]MCW7551643.1 metallophosphatase family protein [Endozoicomonas gorgoniicola]
MSKIAVLSDIHSNVWALESVIKNAKKKGAKKFVNLGDILYGPLAPKETYELLRSEEMITIKGNQDRQIYEANPEGISENPTMQFIFAELPNEALEWMKSLPASLSLPEDIFLCHGVPDNDLVYMVEDVSSGIPKVRNEHEIRRFLSNVSEKLVLCGHSHIPRIIELTNKQLIVNPGSVGLPAYKDEDPTLHIMQNYSSHASYAMIERCTTGWNVEFLKVPYELNSAVNAAKARNRNDWAFALKSGRAA